MFGYHDNDRCGFDLWSPVDENNCCSNTEDSFYSELYGRDSYCATENRAFSAYAKHTQETEDIINACVEQARMGNYNFTLEVDDDFSDSDMEYIEREIQRRL